MASAGLVAGHVTVAIVMHFEVEHGDGAWCVRIWAVRLQVQAQAVSARWCRRRSKDPHQHGAHGERAPRRRRWTPWSCQTQKGCDLRTSPSPSSRCCPPCTPKSLIDLKFSNRSHYVPCLNNRVVFMPSLATFISTLPSWKIV